jgi:hypothetical protein
MKKMRRWALLPLLAVVGYLGLRALGGDTSDTARDEPPGLLFSRLWLEKVPEKPTEHVQGAYVLETPAVGMFQRASAFDYHIELFRHEQKGNKLELDFPQTDKRAKITFAIKGCDDLPPFDLCLTLSENPWGGPKKYHGFRDADDEEKAFPGMREAAHSRAIWPAR